MKTNVLLLKEKDRNDVFAYFPDMGNKKYWCVSYSIIGQHSHCSIEYKNECKEANYNEYLELLKELVRMGYHNLNVLNNQQFEYHRKPTAGELKFGEGATHYLSLPLSDIGITKTGYLKKWFVSPYDGLRYYR